MNVSPLAGKTDLVSVTILVGGNPIREEYELASVKVTREVNRIGSARIVLSDGNPSLATFAISETATFVPGAKVEIRMGYHQAQITVFKGIIVKHGVRVREHGGAQLVLSCADSAVKMTVGRKSSVYCGQSETDVVQHLIETHGLTAEMDVAEDEAVADATDAAGPVAGFAEALVAASAGELSDAATAAVLVAAAAMQADASVSALSAASMGGVSGTLSGMLPVAPADPLSGVAFATSAAPMPDLVRYYSSDWDFMLTRAEASGKVIVVNDDAVSMRAPAVHEACGLIVAYGEALLSIDVEMDARSQLSTVRASAWDISEQKTLFADSAAPTLNAQGNISGDMLADVLKAGTYALMSATPLASDDLQQWADAQLLKSRLARICGTVAFQGNGLATPGKTIELAGLGARFNGDAYIARVVHTLEKGKWVTEVGFGLSPHWFVQETPDVHSAPASGLLPAAQGLQIGTVMQIESDPLTFARVKVNLPLIDAEEKGIWARLGTPYATKAGGLFFMPEIGDEVAVGFFNNDPRFPVILGSLYSSMNAPPYTPDQPNTNKAIVTKGQIKIVLEDVKKSITIETPGGQIVVMSDEDTSISITDSNKNNIKLSSSGVAITSPYDITIKADGSVNIQGTAGVNIKSPAAINVEATETLGLTGKGAAELSSQGEVTVQGSMVLVN